MFSDVFEPEYGVDQSPADDTRITQVILYYDESDVVELKRLAKEAMKIEMPGEYLEKGNLSSLYLIILKKYYGKNIPIETTNDGQGSGATTQRDIPPGAFF